MISPWSIPAPTARIRSHSINAENRTGGAGLAARAASPLGPGRKVRSDPEPEILNFCAPYCGYPYTSAHDHTRRHRSQPLRHRCMASIAGTCPTRSTSRAV